MNRIEYKFDITEFATGEIIKLLKLKPLFKKRTIHSTYYDTDKLKFFYDTIEGLRPRMKVRIRNYNSDKNYNLEFKYSNIFGKSKRTFQLTNFNEVDKKNINSISEVRKFVKYKLKPQLSVSYDRNYFFNKDGRFTVDTKIRFAKALGVTKLSSQKLTKVKILEFKSDDLKMATLFNEKYNLKEHSFSKYCEGISLINNLNM